LRADARDFPNEVTHAADFALESKGHGVLILDLRGILLLNRQTQFGRGFLRQGGAQVIQCLQQALDVGA